MGIERRLSVEAKPMSRKAVLPKWYEAYVCQLTCVHEGNFLR